jgi:hypothetical protein
MKNFLAPNNGRVWIYIILKVGKIISEMSQTFDFV